MKLETSVSLHNLVQSIDAALPRETGSPDTFIVYHDSLEVRYFIERDSLKLELDGYDFTLGCSGRYWLETRAHGRPDFGEARCGSESEPIELTFGYRGRIGWDKGWKLGMRLLPNSVIFLNRCKPKPPGHNFNHFLDRHIQAAFQEPLGTAFAEAITGFDEIAPVVREAWLALHEPQDLFEKEVWLQWQPLVIEADPAGGKGDQLNLRLSFLVNPVMKVGPRPHAEAALFPEPSIRISGELATIPVDVDLPMDLMDEHILDRLRAGSHPFPEITGLSVSGEEGRVRVEVAHSGRGPGPSLEGTFVFNGSRSAIEVQGLAWTPGSLEILSRDFSRLDPDLLRERLELELAFDVAGELNARRQLLPLGVNRSLTETVSTRGAILGYRSESPVVIGSTLRVRHRAFGPVWLSVTPGKSSVIRND